MERLLWIGLGGFVGSVLRYLASGLVQSLARNASFPLGTLAVNAAGCLVIGLLSQWSDSRGAFSPEARSLVFVGILGGFTTFSTFSNETMNLLRDGQLPAALANVGAHLVLGLGAVWLGRTIGYLAWR